MISWLRFFLISKLYFYLFAFCRGNFINRVVEKNKKTKLLIKKLAVMKYNAAMSPNGEKNRTSFSWWKPQVECRIWNKKIISLDLWKNATRLAILYLPAALKAVVHFFLSSLTSYKSISGRNILLRLGWHSIQCSSLFQ